MEPNSRSPFADIVATFSRSSYDLTYLTFFYKFLIIFFIAKFIPLLISIALTP